MKVKQIPAAWRTGPLTSGSVIPREHRSFLMDAPPELVKVLPASTAGIRYCVAGGNVVAVDKSYKVVDSIHIPSVKFDVEVRDGTKEIEIKKQD